MSKRLAFAGGVRSKLRPCHTRVALSAAHFAGASAAAPSAATISVGTQPAPETKNSTGQVPLALAVSGGASDSRHCASLIHPRIRLELDEPVRIDEARDLDDRVGGSNVAEELAMHSGHAFPILDSRKQYSRAINMPKT